MEFRRARESEGLALLQIVQEAFAGYREFAPDWEPPDETAGENVERLEAQLADPDAYNLVADDGRGPVGHVLWIPAQTPSFPDDSIEGLVHFRHLFVKPELWGSGVALHLHGEALSEMRQRQWARARLFTPEGQARSRRFYEREGWSIFREPYFEPRLGLRMVEYRRDLQG